MGRRREGRRAEGNVSFVSFRIGGRGGEVINSTVVIRERFKPPPSSIEAALRFQRQRPERPGDVFQIQFVVAKNTHSTPHYLQCTLLHWRAGRSLICRVPCPLREVSLFRGLAGSAEPRCAIIFFVTTSP